jgi:large subunit ribosomal protein L25
MKLEIRTQKLNIIRKNHLVPGVIFGKSIDSQSIQAENIEVLEAIKTYGMNQVFKVRLDGKYHYVYIKSVQKDILKPNEIIHFSLLRVTPKEVMTQQIPIVLIGKDTFFNQAIYLDLILPMITAEYIYGSGISSFDIDVSKLKTGDEIKVKDLKVPEGITIKNDMDQVILILKDIDRSKEEEEIEVLEIKPEEHEL